jgi:hypothetical protein
MLVIFLFLVQFVLMHVAIDQGVVTVIVCIPLDVLICVVDKDNCRTIL